MAKIRLPGGIEISEQAIKTIAYEANLAVSTTDELPLKEHKPPQLEVELIDGTRWTILDCVLILD